MSMTRTGCRTTCSTLSHTNKRDVYTSRLSESPFLFSYPSDQQPGYPRRYLRHWEKTLPAKKEHISIVVEESLPPKPAVPIGLEPTSRLSSWLPSSLVQPRTDADRRGVTIDPLHRRCDAGLHRRVPLKA